MPAPGPLIVLDPSQYDLTPAPPEFLALEGELFSSLAVLEAELAEPERLAAEAADPQWLAPVDEAILEAAEGLETDQGVADLAELEGAELAGAEIDQLVLEASAAMPAEAWQPVPGAYQPPPELGGFTELPEGAGPGAPSPGAGMVPGVPKYGPSRVQIQNRTRQMATDFRVGEEWVVSVRGLGNSAVRVHARQDGIDRGTAVLGTTDWGGDWSLEGVMADEHIGTWEEEWYVGPVMAEPVLRFEVVEAE